MRSSTSRGRSPVPARAVVDGHLDPADATAGVDRGALDRHRRALLDRAAGGRRGDRGRRRRRVGRRARRPSGRSAACRGWTPMSANRFTVACCIDPSGDPPPRSWFASRPHDHWTVPAAEDQRVRPGAVRVAVEREVMRGRARPVGRAEVLHLLDPAHGRRGEPDEAGGARPVVEVLVPLVADRAVGERRDAAGELAGHGRARHRRSLPSSAGTRSAAEPELTVKIVPVSAFSGRPPCGLNGRGSRHVPVHSFARGSILVVGVRLLVGDERAVVVLPARLPEHLVAAEEGEVHARVARRLDVRALRARTSTRRARPTGRRGARAARRRRGRCRPRWSS